MYTRRRFIGSGLAAGIATQAAHVEAAVAPDWSSLVAAYRTPDWFRDAKFGIWAHWGAQAVPEFGDWYGRLMYVQGDPFYAHHLEHYGHPSRTGFMEIENLWKAQAWEPETLIGLYKKAGARYFTSLACHHDNLDTYDSAHHAWNTLRVGPSATSSERGRRRRARRGCASVFPTMPRTAGIGGRPLTATTPRVRSAAFATTRRGCGARTVSARGGKASIRRSSTTAPMILLRTAFVRSPR